MKPGPRPENRPEPMDGLDPAPGEERFVWQRIPLPARRIPHEARPGQAELTDPERRRDRRLTGAVRVDYSTIDAVPDPASGEAWFHTGEAEGTVNLSRRGLCVLCPVPPQAGTRLLLRVWVPEESRPIELIGRACWTRIEFRLGVRGARPVAAVGVELVGGAARALDRYDRAFARLERAEASAVAGPRGLG